MTRYGPEPASRVTGDRVPRLVLTGEGGGVVSTCLGCGWLRWWPSRDSAAGAGKAHGKCPAKK